MVETIGLVAALILPLWNIPLIIRIQRRGSSDDVSLWWAFGVLVCLLAMLPAALVSTDRVFKVFSVANVVLFAAVVVQVGRYRWGAGTRRAAHPPASTRLSEDRIGATGGRRG
jgi:uncharacterized protein with PQ loop repeat